MKKSIRRILSGLLCAGVLALGIPAPSRALTLTAVNDSILPMTAPEAEVLLDRIDAVVLEAFLRRRAMSMTRTSTAIPHRPIR